MDDDDFPAGLDSELEELALAPLDDSDVGLLREVEAVLSDLDPMPAGLVERVRFALALDEMMAEVAQITRLPADALAVRHDAAAGERTDTLTFSAERLTAMVTVSREDGTLRVDGWIAPPAPMVVRLRMRDAEDREVRADEDGRFVLGDLPEGFAQLSFHADGGEEAAVVTPMFQL